MALGLDLAWGYRAASGAAAVDARGRLLATARLVHDDEIATWCDTWAAATTVAVDAPLVVTNRTGMRACERAVARAYGRYGAGCHPSNLTLLRQEVPRAAALASRLGWRVGPTQQGRPGAPACVEVYPHAALVGLFGLPRRLLYKKGGFATRREGFDALVALLEGWEALDLRTPAWTDLRTELGAATRPVDLDRVEDRLDAVVCAGVALLWQRQSAGGPAVLTVYGDPAADHILAPHPPAP